MRILLVLCMLIAACGDDVATEDSGVLPVDAAVDASSDASAPMDAADAGQPIVTDVTVRSFDGAVQTNLSFAAFQDGDGPWQELEGLGGTYSFTAESGRYGFAYVCAEGFGSRFVRGHVIYALGSELSSFVLSCPIAEDSAPLTGTVSGLTSGESAQIAFGRVSTAATAASPTYSTMVVPGVTDLLARRVVAGGDVDRLIVQRSVMLTGGTRNTDFGGRVPVVSATATAEGGTVDEDIFSNATLITANGFHFFVGTSSGWVGLPEAERAADDIYAVRVSASNPTDQTFRQAVLYTRSVTDVSVTLGPLASDATISTVDTTPYVRLAADVVVDEAQVHRLVYRYSPSASLFWTIDATSEWLTAAGTNTIAMPPLADLPGWDTAWGLEAGMNLGWDVETIDSNGTVGQVLRSLFANTPPDDDLPGLEVTRSRTGGQVLP